MNKDNSKGEIVTLLTIGAFLFIGISSLVSSFFLKNNFSTTSKALTSELCPTGIAEGVSCKASPTFLDGEWCIACTGNQDIGLAYQCNTEGKFNGNWHLPNIYGEHNPTCTGSAAPPGGTQPSTPNTQGTVPAPSANGCFHMTDEVYYNGNNLFTHWVKLIENTPGIGDGHVHMSKNGGPDTYVDVWNRAFMNSRQPDEQNTYVTDPNSPAHNSNLPAGAYTFDASIDNCNGATVHNTISCTTQVDASGTPSVSGNGCIPKNFTTIIPVGQVNPANPGGPGGLQTTPVPGKDMCDRKSNTSSCGVIGGAINMNGFDDLATSQYFAVVQIKSNNNWITVFNSRVSDKKTNWTYGDALKTSKYQVQAKLVLKTTGGNSDYFDFKAADGFTGTSTIDPTSSQAKQINFSFDQAGFVAPNVPGEDVIFKVAGKVVNDAYSADNDVADKLGNYVVIMKVSSSDTNIQNQIDAQGDSSSIYNSLNNNTDSSDYTAQVNLHLSTGSYSKSTPFTCSLSVARADDVSQTSLSIPPVVNVSQCKFTPGVNAQQYVLHINKEDTSKVTNGQQVDFTFSGKLGDLASDNFVSLAKDLSFNGTFSTLSNSDYEVKDKTIKDDGTYSAKITVFKKGSIKNTTRFRVEIISKLAGSIGKIEDVKNNAGSDITGDIPVERDNYNLQIQVGATGRCDSATNPQGSCVPLMYFDNAKTDGSLLACYDENCSGIKSKISSFTLEKRDSFNYVGRTFTINIPYYGGDYSKMKVKAFKSNGGILKVSNISGSNNRLENNPF